MINELRIQNFRGFASLELPDLKRVNLVVGQNNSGKTSLLEAILLLCEPSRVGELPWLFRAQQGKPDTWFFRWLLRDGAKGEEGLLSAKAATAEWVLRLSPPSHQTGVVTAEQDFIQNPVNPALPGAPDDVITSRARGRLFYRGATFWLWGDANPKGKCRVISIQNRDAKALVTLVGKAHRKADGEETLQRLLTKVDPRIKKVRVDPGEEGKDDNQVIVDIGLSELVPVSQAGQGVYRLVSILADIIGEKPDVMLIDEVENGLHHSIHEQIWTGLAETAEKLDVQIFATTHSEECLHAAHNAFLARKEYKEYDLSVIQLFRVESGVQGRVLDRELIEAGIGGNIDLRGL
jgi:ABC-type transport system involved in cytochrome c biogenesis ATPase subunit